MSALIAYKGDIVFEVADTDNKLIATAIIYPPRLDLDWFVEMFAPALQDARLSLTHSDEHTLQLSTETYEYGTETPLNYTFDDASYDIGRGCVAIEKWHTECQKLAREYASKSAL